MTPKAFWIQFIIMLIMLMITPALNTIILIIIIITTIIISIVSMIIRITTIITATPPHAAQEVVGTPPVFTP